MTTMDGGNENNAWSNYFSMAPRHTVHPVRKNRPKPVLNALPTLV